MAARFVTSLFRSSATVFRGVPAAALTARVQRVPLALTGGMRCGVQSIYTMSPRFAQAEASKTSFSDVLQNEIKLEKKAQRKLTPPTGYEAQTDGALAVLKRKFDDGTQVQVLMTISGSLTPERGEGEGEGEGDAQLEARPPFLVRLIKPSGRVLEFSCSFPEDDMFEDEIGDLEETAGKDGEEAQQKPPAKRQPASDDDYPTFNIDSVMLKTKSSIKPTVNEPIKDQEYFSDSDLMDPSIYRGLVDLLLARGINAKFEKELIQFSTALEHDCYVKFLSEMRELVNE